MKRIFLGFCCALYAMSASADTWTDPTTGITWPYVVKNGKAIVGTGGSLLSSNCHGDINIPQQIAGLDVVGINDWAFGNQSGQVVYILRSIGIPYGVETIGRAAFAGAETGPWAPGSELREIVLPDSVTEIGASVFWKCKLLESATLSENLNGISDFAFEECMSLSAIAIPSKVKVIGEQAFYKCSKLQTVSIAENSELTSIGKKAFASCSALEQIVIPAGVTTIGEGAFESCSNLTSVTLPESLNQPSIMTSVFSKCGNIKTIVSYGAPITLRHALGELYYTAKYAEEWETYLKSLPPDKRPFRAICMGSDVTVLSVFNGGGTTSFKKKAFAWGESVTIEATPNEGFVFLGWSSDTDGIEGTDPTLTFTMPEEPVTLVANFFPKALVQGWVDAAVEAKVDGTTLLTPEQAEKKAEEAINEKVASGDLVRAEDVPGKVQAAIDEKVASKELITSESLQLMAMKEPFIEVRDGKAKVGIYLQTEPTLEKPWEVTTVESATVEEGKVRVVVSANGKAAFYRFVVPDGVAPAASGK